MHHRGTEDAETGYWRNLCVLAVSVVNSPNSWLRLIHISEESLMAEAYRLYAGTQAARHFARADVWAKDGSGGA